SNEPRPELMSIILPRIGQYHANVAIEKLCLIVILCDEEGHSRVEPRWIRNEVAPMQNAFNCLIHLPHAEGTFAECTQNAKPRELIKRFQWILFYEIAFVRLDHQLFQLSCKLSSGRKRAAPQLG